jgi:hypothetical protein
MLRSTFRCLASIAIPAGLLAADISVSSSSELQRALTDARPGDNIVLGVGAAYTGNFVLPNKGPADAYITIRSSQSDSLRPGARVRPDDGRFMAAIVTPNSAPAIDAADGANHYRLIGLEVRPAPGVYVYDLVRLGSGETASANALPYDFVLDRVYVHGDAGAGSKRGIALNCKQVVIQNAHISDFKSTSQDTQAVAGWNGPGPFTVTNSYLEASGENLLFGGSPPVIPGLVPSDITIEGNYFFKPLSWRPGTPAYAGTAWSVKNLLELKSAQRVRISGNVFENDWVSAQNGFAILFTVRATSDPTAVVKDIAFTDNLVSNTPGVVNILGIDDAIKPAAGQTSNLVISNNLLTGVTNILFQILNGAKSITIEHNTGLQGGSAVVADALPSPGLVFRDNLVAQGTYGVFGGGAGSGTAALKAYFPGYVFQKNVVVGADPDFYPPGNYYPKTVAEVGFVDYANGNLALGPRSRFARAGSGGSAPGARVTELQPVFEAARSGRGR